jgi:hypothetical protein
MSEWSARKCECSGEDACAFAVERDKALAQLAELRTAAEVLLAMLDRHATGSFGDAEDDLRAVLARQTYEARK